MRVKLKWDNQYFLEYLPYNHLNPCICTDLKELFRLANWVLSVSSSGGQLFKALYKYLQGRPLEIKGRVLYRCV